MSDAAEAAPPIPGLRLRYFTGADDHPGMLAVHEAAHAADGVDEVTTLDRFTLAYETLVRARRAPGRGSRSSSRRSAPSRDPT